MRADAGKPSNPPPPTIFLPFSLFHLSSQALFLRLHTSSAPLPLPPLGFLCPGINQSIPPVVASVPGNLRGSTGYRTGDIISSASNRFNRNRDDREGSGQAGRAGARVRVRVRRDRRGGGGPLTDKIGYASDTNGERGRGERGARMQKKTTQLKILLHHHRPHTVKHATPPPNQPTEDHRNSFANWLRRKSKRAQSEVRWGGAGRGRGRGIFAIWSRE